VDAQRRRDVEIQILDKPILNIYSEVIAAFEERGLGLDIEAGCDPDPARPATPNTESLPFLSKSTVGKTATLKLPLLMVSAEFISTSCLEISAEAITIAAAEIFMILLNIFFLLSFSQLISGIYHAKILIIPIYSRFRYKSDKIK
jgi:hypothetical protein